MQLQNSKGSLGRIEEGSIEADAAAPISFFSLLRFADGVDWLLMILGAIASLGAGCTGPLLLFLLTEFNTSYHSNDADAKRSSGTATMLEFIYLGLGGLACGWGTVTLWMIAGERQSQKCRQVYYQSLMRQEIEFYDCNQQSQFHSRFSIDTLNFQGAIGQKTALVIQIIGSFICTLVLSFLEGWLMALLILSVLPLMIFAMYFNLVTFEAKQKNFLNAYSIAGGRAEEVIASIKTVKQFSAQNFHADEYVNQIKDTSDKKLKIIVRIGVSFGFLNGTLFLIYALGLWFGANCVIGSSSCPVNVSGKYYTIQNVEVVFFTLVVSCFGLSGFSPAIKKIAIGFDAAKRIFQVIDRVPKINQNTDGLICQKFKGNIQFRNVSFAYPKDRSKQILSNCSIIFNSHSSGLVGESGCGKSTIAQLLMRFYDPDEGQILLDGHNLKEYNLNWLRSQIGYVGQQPILFAATIKENLLYASPSATEEEMKEALKQAEVYTFINEHLEHKLQTYVGAGGSQISGGQKQRIAIARALLKKPSILILDEATSALDRVNQKLIQDTLNRISKKLTTITIAHRIGTIINCNQIFVLANGRVEQSGKFEELQFFKNVKYLSEEEAISAEDLQLELKQRINIQKQKVIVEEQKQKLQKRQEQEKKQLLNNYENGMKKRILSYCKDKKVAFAIAIILSAIQGVIYPVFSIYVGKIIAAIFNLETDKNDQDSMDKVRLSSLAFFLIGIGTFFIYFFQTLLGYLAGDQIVENLRQETYKKILKMPMKWFDKHENTSGALGHCLGHSCEIIHQLVTTYFFILIQAISTLISGFTIAFVYQWRITFVALGLFPLMVISGFIRSHFKVGLSKKVDQTHKQINGMITESLINIRTVYAFNMPAHLSKKYEASLNKAYQSLTKAGILSGFMNGFGTISMNITFGFLLYLGMIFMVNNGVTLENLLTAIFTCIFTGFYLGNNLNFMPDVVEAKTSAANIFNILDTEDQEQMQKREKSLMLTEGFKSQISFKNVIFKYENRQNYVLNKISFDIKEGQKIAFVGPSGCGKSTIMQILLRFYQPQQGRILINSINIKDFDIKYLRSQFGVVSQEPTVFNTSFRENIRYNTFSASQEDIREASRKANALAFIQGKENNEENNNYEPKESGFDRVVGLKGLHISGGQKQRVAIARAILKNPKILLLDEATSALDAENQKNVQNSLNQIMKDKTTITVAHRIQTIYNSDMIYLINNGIIAEQGTYQQLTEIKGLFYNFERGEKI